MKNLLPIIAFCLYFATTSQAQAGETKLTKTQPEAKATQTPPPQSNWTRLPIRPEEPGVIRKTPPTYTPAPIRYEPSVIQQRPAKVVNKDDTTARKAVPPHR